MIKGGYIVSALCVYALLSVATSCTPASAAEAAPRQEVMVSVPLSKLTELQSLISRQELQNAKSSLSSSKQIINEQNASLMSLSATLKQEQRRTRRIERQRLLWQAVAGGAVVYVVLKE